MSSLLSPGVNPEMMLSFNYFPFHLISQHDVEYEAESILAMELLLRERLFCGQDETKLR